MKKRNYFLSILFALLMVAAAQTPSQAQAPKKFDYQAVARNADDSPMANTSMSVRMTVLEGSANGSISYQENHTVTTDKFGLFTLTIGGGSTLSGSFTTIDWSTGNYFIQTEIDPNGGSSYTDMGTSELMSVPYALYGEDSDWTANGNNIYNGNTGNVGIGTANPTEMLQVDFGNILIRGDNAGAMSLKFDDVDTGNEYEIGADNSQEVLSIKANGTESMAIATDGEIGIGTNTPDAKLDVNGSTKLGPAGTVFSEIREFTGTTHATNAFVFVTLPSGYTEDNTRVLSLEIHYNNDRWSGTGHDNGGNDNTATSYIINDQTLYIYYPNLTSYKNRAFRIMLMRVE